MTLGRFRVRNHPQQLARRGESLFPELADPTDEVDDRATHPALFSMLSDRFGGFSIDVAASAQNTKCERFYDRETDGLAQSWEGERVWCNPPYSDIRPWVFKAAMERDAELIVMLLPANRTEQGWWQELVEPWRDRGGRLSVEFLAGRPRFIQPPGLTAEKGDRPPFGCCVLVWYPA